MINSDIHECVQKTLTIEKMTLYNQMRNSMVSRRNVVGNCMKEVTSGKERVNTGTQVYKSLILSHLLLVTMFDSEVFLYFCSSDKIKTV